MLSAHALDNTLTLFSRSATDGQTATLTVLSSPISLIWLFGRRFRPVLPHVGSRSTQLYKMCTDWQVTSFDLRSLLSPFSFFIRLLLCSYAALHWNLFVLLWTPLYLKKGANLSFTLDLSNMNRFQWKLVGMSRNKPLTKMNINCPVHLKYVLAPPWEIQSVWLSRQRSIHCVHLND